MAGEMLLVLLFTTANFLGPYVCSELSYSYTHTHIDPYPFSKNMLAIWRSILESVNRLMMHVTA